MLDRLRSNCRQLGIIVSEEARLSLPTYTWAVAKQDKLSNEKQLSDKHQVPQIRMPKRTFFHEKFDNLAKIKNILLRSIVSNREQSLVQIEQTLGQEQKVETKNKIFKQK